MGVSPGRPASFHELTCAREPALPGLYPHTTLGPDGHSHLPVLVDEGYIGIGIRPALRRRKDGQVLDTTHPHP